ncbi:UNVERIFIED_CONTAM: Stomatal closure-related actin-binding protein 1 [Sesamum radiatum]|uniref:Stomatal closure-related actin-binding protein 1 n=1 Tax=Sesamum radiatum TaxID=300843 RepID=A0AAW2W3C6_SESRA
MQKDMVSPVSADVYFASSRFPNYKIGANNQIVEVKEDSKTATMKDMVARETALLLEQQKRLSVRDLASKFEKGLAAAAKLSDEASEDAKKLVDEERAFARAEIENARAAVQRVEEALQEHEQMSRASGKQLALSKKGDKDAPHLYDIDGTLALGSYLLIYRCSDSAPELSECAFQWYRTTSEGGKKEPISGATKSVYAPEPFDVGRKLQADILIADHTITLTTSAPIDPGSIALFAVAG